MPVASSSEESLMRNSSLDTTMQRETFLFYPMLAPFPMAFFVAALITDLIYWRAPDAMWETFSIWLITAGLVMAGFAVLGALVDLAGRRRRPSMRPAWPQAVFTAVAFLLALINAFVHSRDGYTAVVPTGLMLSALVVAMLICAAWMRRDAGAVYVSSTGVSP
jgi:uncharacterized membrane protein